MSTLNGMTLTSGISREKGINEAILVSVSTPRGFGNAGPLHLQWKCHMEKTDVPCSGCTECCKSNQGLFLHPEQGDDVESYRHRTLTDQVTGNPIFLLATEANGQCVYLGVSGCTIYERRPLLCRSFDCRKHYLILPRQDRDNLVRLGLASRAVLNAGRVRLKSLSPEERKECLETRDEFFSEATDARSDVESVS